MQRTIEGPDREYLNTTDAARWLGITDSTFLALVAEHPWMQPTYTGKGRKGKMWHATDLAVFSYVLRHRGRPSGQGNTGEEDDSE